MGCRPRSGVGVQGRWVPLGLPQTLGTTCLPGMRQGKVRGPLERPPCPREVGCRGATAEVGPLQPRCQQTGEGTNRSQETRGLGG